MLGSGVLSDAKFGSHDIQEGVDNKENKLLGLQGAGNIIFSKQYKLQLFIIMLDVLS